MSDPDPNLINDILDGVKIPPAPEILTSLNNELQKDEPELGVLAGIIQRDAGLSALVIRTVNSPMFPLRSQVSSIPQAISLLGIGYMINIVMGLVLRRSFDADDRVLPGFWDSASNIAMVMSRVSRRVGGIASDEAYMLGLFHNAGHSLINQRFADYADFYRQHLNDPEGPISLFEQARYNFDHATLGYYLARSWGLPAEICEVIRRHHEVEELLEQGDSIDGENPVARMASVLKLAEHVDRLFHGVDEDHDWARSGLPVLSFLALSEPDYRELRDDMLDMLNTEAP